MATARVRRRWALACESLDVTKPKEREWWRRVETGYGEPGRHYHTLVHIDAMLTLATKYEVRDRVAVDLATISTTLCMTPLLVVVAKTSASPRECLLSSLPS